MKTTGAIRARNGHQDKYSLLSITEHGHVYDIQIFRLILSIISQIRHSLLFYKPQN